MLDISKKLVTEDYFVDWIKNNDGILVTRKELNVNNKNLSQCRPYTMVGLTGYPQIVEQFFSQIIQNFSNKIILVTLETDFFPMKDEYLNHPLWLLVELLAMGMK